MTVTSVKIKSRQFKEFSANETELSNNRIEISGSYALTIVNEGLIPVPSVSVSIGNLSYDGRQIIEDKSESIGRLSSGQEETVSFSFSFTTESENYASSVCDGEALEHTVSETVNGLLLGVIFEDSAKIEPLSTSCDLGGSTLPVQPPDPDPQPDPDPDPEPPDDGSDDGNGDGGGGGGGPDIGGPDDPDDEVEPAPDPVEMEIQGATEPLEDLDNTYDAEDDPDNTSEYVWTMPEGDAFDERTTSDDEITVVFEDPQYFTIEVEALNPSGQVIGQGSIQGRVLDQFGGDDDPRDDTPPPR